MNTDAISGTQEPTRRPCKVSPLQPKPHQPHLRIRQRALQLADLLSQRLVALLCVRQLPLQVDHPGVAGLEGCTQVLCLRLGLRRLRAYVGAGVSGVGEGTAGMEVFGLLCSLEGLVACAHVGSQRTA
eukprot:364323-Chlamydomonas_euryale.AAC.29